MGDDENENILTQRIMGYNMRKPYKGSVGAIGVIIGVLLIGAFVSWYFFSSSDEQSQNQQPESEQSQQSTQLENQSEPQLPGNDYEDGTGRSALYNFFYHVFGGIEDGLEDSPHNLANVEHIDDMNIDKQFNENPTSSGNSGSNNNRPLVLNNSSGNNANSESGSNQNNKQNQAQNNNSGSSADSNQGQKSTGASTQSGNNRAAHTAENPDDQYRNSVYDIVGSEVFSDQGGKIGVIHDILVNKETGKAQAIIVNDQSGRYERDLTAIAFNRVTQEQAGKDAVFTAAREKIKDAPDFTPNFTYEAIKNNKEYISLRLLRAGQVLDFEGKTAGEVDAIIYENAEAQNIYFTLRPLLAQRGPSKYFMSFKEANIVTKQNGYDIQLTKEQTERLAKVLFQSDSSADQQSASQ